MDEYIVCVNCGELCSKDIATQDDDWNYWCPDCWDAAIHDDCRIHPRSMEDVWGW